MSEIYSAYEFKHFANKGKIEKIKAVLKEYRKTAQDIANFPWVEFFKNGGKFPHKKKEPLEEFLNPRQGLPLRVGMHGLFVHTEGNSVESKLKWRIPQGLINSTEE